MVYSVTTYSGIPDILSIKQVSLYLNLCIELENKYTTCNDN